MSLFEQCDQRLPSDLQGSLFCLVEMSRHRYAKLMLKSIVDYQFHV